MRGTASTVRIVAATIAGIGIAYIAVHYVHTGIIANRLFDSGLHSSLLATTSVSDADLPGAKPDSGDLIRYTGIVPHIFFHSLIIYPKEASADRVRSGLFKSNMITVDEFRAILSKMYAGHFVLIDSRLLYSIGPDGKMHKREPLIPKDKKPFVLSLDDLDYYETMKSDGFADKLVLSSGKILTEVVRPDGSVALTNDGDVVPIIDDFIAKHPDFSFGGARGIIGVTGYDGILGYRTQLPGTEGEIQKKALLPVVAALKKEGWIFASHSYSHEHSFMQGTISTTSLSADIAKWRDEVGTLVGPTNVYIGPFGQIFSASDPRRTALLSAGFHVLYGVGLDQYVRYYDTYVQMDRIDVDGYRLAHNEKYLKKSLGI